MKIVVLILSVLVVSTNLAFAQSDSASYYYTQGQQAKTAGRTLQAFHYFQKAMQLNANERNYVRAAAITAVDLRKYEFGKQLFQQLYESDKNDTLAISQLAQLNFSLRKWKEAIAFAEIMRLKNIRGRYNYILGKSNYEDENYADSYKYLQAASKDEPNNAEIPYLIARSFVDMNNYKMAVQFFEQALAKDSTKANWYYETALTYFAVPDAKKAIVYFEKAINKGYKTSSDVLENLSNAYVEAGQPEKGIEVMKQLLAKKPADVELLWNVAEAHFKIGKYNEAIEYWDRILYYDKANASALYMIGLSYQKKGEKAKGEQLCDKAITMDPSLKSLKQKKQLPIGL